MVCDRAFWLDRLATKKEQLALLDEMFLHFAANGGAEEYDLDTGQTRQKVRRADLSKWRLLAEKLESQISALIVKTSGCGVSRVRGTW